MNYGAMQPDAVAYRYEEELLQGFHGKLDHQLS